jgi:hypothetical protein
MKSRHAFEIIAAVARDDPAFARAPSNCTTAAKGKRRDAPIWH